MCSFTGEIRAVPCVSVDGFPPLMGDVSSRFTRLTNFTDVFYNVFIREKELLTSIILDFKNRTVVL